MRYRAGIMLSAVLALAAALFSAPLAAAEFTDQPACTIFNAAGKIVNPGPLKFDGATVMARGVSGSTIVVAKFVVPADAAGKTIAIAAFDVSGGAFKKVTVSKSACVFNAGGPGTSAGLTATAYLSVGSAGGYNMNVEPGGTYYLNIKLELPFGGPSCGPGKVCDFAIRAYPPG